MGYRRQTDCPADSGQLVASGKLVQILVNENVLFDANVNRRDMLPVQFFKVCLVWSASCDLQVSAHSSAAADRSPCS